MDQGTHSPNIGITEEQFGRLRREYRRRWGVNLCAVDAEGRMCLGGGSYCEREEQGCRQARAAAIQEALRWGEPTVGVCEGQRLLWAVPLMLNERVVGGLVASASERKVFPPGPAAVPFERPPRVHGAAGAHGGRKPDERLGAGPAAAGVPRRATTRVRHPLA